MPGYGYFLKRGETTWPEYWEVDGITSRIHTCYTGIAGYFMRGVAGIQADPKAWGMQRFIIKPQMVGDLAWAKASSETLYGEIASSWSRKEGSLQLALSIPPNTIATVYMPLEAGSEILESGVEAAKAQGVKLMGIQDGCGVYELGSGNYELSRN